MDLDWVRNAFSAEPALYLNRSGGPDVTFFLGFVPEKLQG